MLRSARMLRGRMEQHRFGVPRGRGEGRKGMEETSSARPKTRGRMLGLVGAFSLLLAQLVFSAGPAPAQVPAPVLYGADGGKFEEEASLYKGKPATGGKNEKNGGNGLAGP